MNTFANATQELVSPEVSTFFGIVQGKWNRPMESALLDLIGRTIQSSDDAELKHDLGFFKKKFENIHENFSTKSLIDTLNILTGIGFTLSIEDERLKMDIDKGDLRIDTDKGSLLYFQLDTLASHYYSF